MTTNNVQRNYNLHDAELCMFASNLCNFLTRDLFDYAAIGLNADKIARFKGLADVFKVFPTDGSLIGDIMIMTEGKNALRRQVLVTIREMALRIEVKWGTSSVRYRHLDIHNPSQMTDDTLLVSARAVHTKMAEYLTDLEDYGLSQEKLDDFEKLNADFEKAKNAQADAVTMRYEKKFERINLGNEIFRLIRFYCNYGKLLYEKTNPAKYNDYLIYDTSSVGSTKAPENLGSD